jgi:catechol 2,3-dioxygenase-like lactoylglutathione lyase family enzyme
MAGQALATVALLVPDYDEAIRFFREKLGFELLEDRPVEGEKRWVVMAPSGGQGARLLLARAVGERQRARIGDQTGGRVFLFLETDDVDRDHRLMREKGVRFAEAPRDEPYGRVAVFEDFCGNRWDLIQPRRP